MNTKNKISDPVNNSASASQKSFTVNKKINDSAQQLENDDNEYIDNNVEENANDQEHEDTNSEENGAVRGGENDEDTGVIEFSSFKNFQAYSATIEIIAKVDAIVGPERVGKDQTLICKLHLSNGNGEKLQLIAWKDEIPKILPDIRTNTIVHIENVYCKPISNPRFDKGTEGYDLVVQSNTTINVLGLCEVIQGDDAAQSELAPLVRIRDLFVTEHREVRVQGYIKTTFGLIKKADRRNQCICGSITDKHILVEIRLFDIEQELNFSKGDHVEVKGSIQKSANPIYILVQQKDDIRVISSEKMSLRAIVRITQNVNKQSHSLQYDSDN